MSARLLSVAGANCEHDGGRRARPRRLLLAAVSAAASLAFVSSALAVAPWDGSPLSPGLGPTYGEAWCAPPTGENVAGLQGPPLALIPYAAIECSLQKFQAEATAAGIPQRMTYEVIGQSALGRPLYGVVVNALETPDQVRDFERWQQLRAIELEDPAAARALLASWGDDVKMPIFIEANIHGDEREGADAIMQALRDLTTTPRGASPVVDKVLDDSVLVVIPSQNPDGRIAGTRSNGNGFDMNRDFLVQSQSETKASIKLQQKWLATNGLALHGYVQPTLIDGLTKPHNPGLEYDIFLFWNQFRLDANEADFANIVGAPGSNGFRVTRPVNDWNSNGGTTGSTGPAFAESWDDWGPFYTQTYISLLGLDGSTVEMCSSTTLTGGCGGQGRLGSKKSQYVAFYSSVNYWLDNKNAMMDDQIEIYQRGVDDAERPNCCDHPDISSRGFTEAEHNWMVEYPRAYVIPRNGGGQRSNAEANRLAQWLLDNGIEVHEASSAFTWSGVDYPAGSYIVYMDQALRGLALTALDAGQDISDRISILYAPPGAWSHGSVWGADVVEIPRGSAFAPAGVEISAPTPAPGGVRGGTGAPADWYSVTVRGVIETKAVLGLLRDGVTAELAEASFTSTTGGVTPAGSLIFGNDPATVAAIEAAGQATGVWFERNVGVAKPPTTLVERAPKVALLVNSANPARSDTSESLKAIFGSDAAFVSVTTGTNSLQNAATDPLAGFDVIYNIGQTYPSAASPTARARLQAFFARGGGYIGTSQSGNNFTFVPGAGLVAGAFTQGSAGAGGGIALWSNEGGSGSPVTGGYPAQDTLFLPSNITYFSALPTGAVIDGRYLGSTTDMFLAGLWRNRNPVVAGAPMVVHGDTLVGSRYMGLAANPFSRQDAEREWPLIGQAALWSTLTDEARSAIAFPTGAAYYNRAGFDAGCGTAAGDICGTASATPGPGVSKVTVAVQEVSSGLWWDGSAFAAASPLYLDAVGTTDWSFPFAASQLPADGDYVVRAKAISVGGNDEVTPSSTRFTLDSTPPFIEISEPVDGASYLLDEIVEALYECEDTSSGVVDCDGPVASGAPFATSPVGFHDFTVVASDGAGNTSSATATYQVFWPFTLGSPANQRTEVNAGSTLPVKFELAGDRGLDVLAAGGPESRRVNCSTNAALGPRQPTASTGGGLRYESGVYHYNWKTSKAWEGTCRQLILELTDTSVHTLTLRFD